MSQNEFAIYRRYIREQSNRVDADLRRLESEQGRLNAEIEKQKFAVRTLADHERARFELTRTLLYTFIVSGTGVTARVLALFLVDRVGRKPLIIMGYLGAGCASRSVDYISAKSWRAYVSGT